MSGDRRPEGAVLRSCGVGLGGEGAEVEGGAGTGRMFQVLPFWRFGKAGPVVQRTTDFARTRLATWRLAQYAF